MAMDATTRRELDGLKQIIRNLQQQVNRQAATNRTPQLGHSSITDGSLDVVDPATGEIRGRWGFQPDGTVAMVTEGGTPPPAPTAPVVAGAPLGLMVQWDGQLAHGLVPPLDLDHVAVHVSATAGFTPGPDTYQGTILRHGGVLPVVPLEVGTTYYVVLVPVTTGGVTGAPSEETPGTPEGVGGVPAPGSITETEIADDAISTPKLRALAVQAHHIAVNTIEAGHITAGAVEASKLAAEIVLASRIIAGTPGAARTELDATGLKVYDDDNVLILTTEGGGLALTGTILGSRIEGSSVLIGTETGDHIWIGEDEEYQLHAVRARGGGAQVEMAATEYAAEMRLTPPPSSAGEEWLEGIQYAYVAVGSGFVYPAVAYNSPASAEVFPRAATSEIQLEGGSTTVDASRVRHRADVHHFSMGAFSNYLDGVLEIDPGLSFRSSRHAPVRTDMVAAPTGAAGGWVAFTAAQWAPVSFRTPHSGRVRITITAAAGNTATANATIHFGFALSGGSTISPAVSRSWNARAVTTQCCSRVLYLTLESNTNYTLTPYWNASSGTWGTNINSITTYEHSYVVEPLM